MSTLSKEEIERIAALSCLSLTERESETFSREVKGLLDYTEIIKKVELGAEVEAARSVNVFREDKAVSKEPAAILAVAPKSDNSFFIVPRVLD